MEYVATIGLECHAQLRTRSKMFCGCPVSTDAPPNRATCPTCLGHPGTLPRLNTAAIGLGIRAGIALGCAVQRHSVFSRKHYFCGDLPKGYQITQHDRPLCTGGALHVERQGEIRRHGITRIHLEEDAGRITTGDAGAQVDWNRAGVPLVEIVGAPDLGSAEEAEDWLRALHRVLVASGVCAGDMEKGHLRCDANVSLAPAGAPPGARVEIKNINSFRFVGKALRCEIVRQTGLLRAGEPVPRETRHWTGKDTAPSRMKEQPADYRFFADPDLPPLCLTEAEIEAERGALPGAPLDRWLLDQDNTRRADLRARHGLSDHEAGVLLAEPEVLAFFEASVAAGGAPSRLVPWVMRELLHCSKQQELGLSACALEPEALVELVELVESGAIHRGVARALLDELWREGGRPRALVAARGLGVHTDDEALRAAARAVIADAPDVVARLRAGRRGLLDHLVGQLMKVFDGKADPKRLADIVRRELEAG